MTYIPEHFEQQDRAEIEAFLVSNPFGTVVVNLNGELWPTPMPLIWRPAEDGWGTFIAHVALNNDMWQADADDDVLVIAQGPNAYITPNWYPTKADTHEVVPTWNYVSVHAWGKMTVRHDSKFKRMAVGLLTKIHEASNDQPWRMSDAPQKFLENQLEHIVGIEIAIDRLKAKWKMSQNRTEMDRSGVIAGLAERATGDDAFVRNLIAVEQKGSEV